MIDESLLTSRFVEFHDARVLDASAKDGLLTIYLNAWVYDNGKDGHGDAVFQRIDLMLENAVFEWIHDPGEENWTLDGSLDVDDVHHQNELPVPFEATGAVSIQLVGGDGFSFTAKGSRVTLVIAGPPTLRQAGWK